MTLVGPWLSNITTKKRQEKITKSKQLELERGWRDRNQRLKEMHLPKETFEQYMEWVYGRGKKEIKKKNNRNQSSQTNATTYSQNTSDVQNKSARQTNNDRYESLKTWVTGPCSSKPSPTYTGEKMIGISQMAKSNAVPVFNIDEIIDIARMRR